MAMQFGRGSTDASVAATETTAPVASTSSGLYTWSTARGKAKVHNHPDSGQTMYVKWNASTASTTDWDDVLEPGDSSVFPGIPRDAMVEKVAVWIDGTMTYLTDYQVRGWE